MEEGQRPSDCASFLYSPIPKDPTQLFFVDENRPLQQRKSAMFDTETLEHGTTLDFNKSSGYTPSYVAQLESRVVQLEKERKENRGDSDRQLKRQRLEMESIAVSKTEQLKREVEALEIQLQRNAERHQIEMKERDLQLERLRRQLQYAVTEEEATRKELKMVKNEYLTEKLKLQKKNVELDSQLQFVEASLSEWKEKALELESELQLVSRQSKLEIQLLTDELDAMKENAEAVNEKDDPLLKANFRLLEAQLQEKEMEVEQQAKTLMNAQETLESARDVRQLNERVAELESTERKLKAELVDLIEASKNSSILEEKLYLANQKLKTMDERYAAAQKKIESYLQLEESQKQFLQFFEPFASDAQNGVTVNDLKKQPAAAVIKLYKARQNAFEMLFEQKGNAEIQLRRLEKQNEKLQSDLITSTNHAAKLDAQLAELLQKIMGTNNIVAHLRKVNEELVAILETYEKSPEDKDAATSESSRRIALLESSLKQAEEMIKNMETTQKTMATPVIVKKYEGRIERLEKEVGELKHQNTNLSKHLEKAEMDLAVYEKRLGKGEFNVETTKIVHLAVNPTYELLRIKAQSNEVAQLKSENEALRKKLEALTGSSEVEAKPSPSELTTTTSYETVEGQKLLNQRLKEVFREQIQQYREAIYRLTGYKVDLKKSEGGEILRLRSMYADHDDDELLVRMDATGTLELLETEYCAQIDQRVFAYLTACRSFPAFLGNLTLHLFERQTFQGH